MRKILFVLLGVAGVALAAWLMSLFVPRICAVPTDLTAQAEPIIPGCFSSLSS